MPSTIHLHVRMQVTADDVSGIEQAVQTLQQAVEAAGGDWRGGMSVESTVIPEPAPTSAPSVEGEADVS